MTDEGTSEFFPVDSDDEVDDRPLDMTDGWDHEHDFADVPEDPDPPPGIVTFLGEEVAEDA